jgi:predicted nucleic acid-binding protein
MNGDNKPIIYWDACIFYAFFKGEEHKPGELEEIKKQAQLIDANQLILITSAITLTEVLSGKLPADKKDVFPDLFKRPNILCIETTLKIARLGHQIRDYYKCHTDFGGKTVSTPDAIHLASAITYDADVFYNFIRLMKNTRNMNLAYSSYRVK